MTNDSFLDLNETDYQTCEVETNSIYFQSLIYFMYSVIFMVATVGNGIICYIVLSFPRMRTITNYFIMNLALGDLLITVLCVPFTSVSYLKQYWPFGSILCPVVNYSQAVAVFVSSYTLVIISVDRYMAIMWPLKPRMSKRVAAFIIFVVWFVSAITVLPIYILSTLTQPSEWHLKCNQSICSEDWSEVGEGYDTLYSKILLIFQYVIPISVFVFAYTSIAVVIWCHRTPGEAENCRDQRIARTKRKMVKMMVTVVVVYTICWLPLNVFWIVVGSMNDELKRYFWFTLHLLAMSHACYNPIIYCYMNMRFRAGIQQILSSIPCCRRCLTSLLTRRPKSSTSFPLTSIEGTDTTVLHRDNTCTTYISMRPKSGSRITATLHQRQMPIRSVSMKRASVSSHSQNIKQNTFSNIFENRI